MSSWFRRPVNIVITVVAALMAVAALAIIIWKVSTRDLDAEAPLLEVCWQNGQAYYIGGVDEDEGELRGEEQCEGTSELTWPREEIPLSVVARASAGEGVGEGSPAHRAISAAIRDLNAQAGCDLLRLVPPGDVGADVVVHWGAAFVISGEEASNAPGTCTHRGAGVPVEAHVTVRGGLSERFAYLVLLHELGHALGLGHNGFRGSVMFPLTVDDTESEHMTGGRFSDGSVQRLGRLCRQ